MINSFKLNIPNSTQFAEQIPNFSFSFDKSIPISKKTSDEVIQIAIGDSIRGYLKFQITNTEFTIETDEFNTYPTFYTFTSHGLQISSDLKRLDLNIPPEPELEHWKYYIQYGTLEDGKTPFSNIHVVPKNSIVTFKDNKLEVLKKPFEMKSFTFDSLYTEILRAVEYLIEKCDLQCVSLTGGVDTRVILACLLDLNEQHKFYYYTTDLKTPHSNYDIQVARKICKLFGLKQQTREYSNVNYRSTNHSQGRSDNLRGKFGSEFFSGTFLDLKPRSKIQLHHQFESVPFLEYYSSALSDVYGQNDDHSFFYPTVNLYSNFQTPYNFRSCLLALVNLQDDISNYGFQNWIFEKKHPALGEIEFNSHFTNFHPRFQSIEKPKKAPVPPVVNLGLLDHVYPPLKEVCVSALAQIPETAPSHRAAILRRGMALTRFFNEFKFESELQNGD